ncbi:hypothetical protein BDW72DRAFT_53593 [Aspergillus terricola var. indicus]
MKALFEMYLVRRLKTIRAFRLSGGNLCSTVLACHNLGGHLGWEKTGPRQGKLRKDIMVQCWSDSRAFICSCC